MSEPRFAIRSVRPGDDARVAEIIRAVMPQFGACGPGFAINDPEVDHMSAAYARPRCAYFVLERDGVVVGGGGVAPLEGGDGSVCELRKMYFLPEARGQGWGARMLHACLEAARGFGYRTCYLETLERMEGARHLYEKAGFRPVPGPMGNTGHFSCDRFYALAL